MVYKGYGKILFSLDNFAKEKYELARLLWNSKRDFIKNFEFF